MRYTWNNQEDLRKREMIMYRGLAKLSIGQCRVCATAENLNKTFEGHNFYKSRADPQICSRVYSDEFSLTFT